MSANTIGQLFRVTTWGESHGPAVGAIVDGCPPCLDLEEDDIQHELDRRRPGQNDLTTSRDESDTVRILSGVFEGRTLGTPISMQVINKDSNPADYEHMRSTYRPGHADYTYQSKYGIRNWQGGGRASARETVARVAAGAIAKKILNTRTDIEILAYVKQIGHIAADVDLVKLNAEQIESNQVRCPDQPAAEKMQKLIIATKDSGDSIGGLVECIIRNCSVGLGEPVFDKLDADLAKACLSIPATKGFEIGSGFSAVTMSGSEHNDLFTIKDGSVLTRTNHAGGVLGGISNGADIVFRLAFKPVSTIQREQPTITTELEETTIKGLGRHDPCVVPRAVPIVEAMVSIVLADHLLRHKAQCE